MVFVAVLAGGANYAAAAYFQSRGRFGTALAFTQSANFLALAAAAAIAATKGSRALPAVAVIAAGYVVTATVGWALLLREIARDGGARSDEAFPWREALSYAGVSAVSILLGQLERFLVPKLLGLAALATFGVLAATVGSVFRILLLGVGHTMLPRLRAAPTLDVRRRLVAQEAAVVTGVAVMASVALWFVTPLLVRWAVAGKYALPPALVLASILAGLVKLYSVFSRSVVAALGDARQLAQLNFLGWMSMAVAVAGGVLGSRYGLVGLVYGTAVGWLSQALWAAHMAAPFLRAGAVDERVESVATAGEGLA
jgi:hypothetical protein